jgi:hypothetical protein
MAAAKKKSAAPTATANTAVSAFGVPSERLMKLSIDSKVPDPYPVTDKISVAPLTKKRGTALREAHMSILVYQTLLSEAMRQSNTAPSALPADASEAEASAHQEAVAAWEESIKNNEEVMQALSKNIVEAETAYNEAFFGDAHDEVMAYFEQQPQKLWDAFVADIKADFLPAMPTGGVCPTCGNVEDQAEAGKPPASSTSSITTGTQ